jgi:hypothetical protein
MPKNPTRMLSMRLGGRLFGVGVGDGRGVGVGVGVGAGVGVGVGVGVGEGTGDGVADGTGDGTGTDLSGVGGVGVGEGTGDGVGEGRGVGAGLTGFPAGRVSGPVTRIRSGRVGRSSLTVQPHAAIKAAPAIQWVILIISTLSRNGMRGSHLNGHGVKTFFANYLEDLVARILLVFPVSH